MRAKFSVFIDFPGDSPAEEGLPFTCTATVAYQPKDVLGNRFVMAYLRYESRDAEAVFQEYYGGRALEEISAAAKLHIRNVLGEFWRQERGFHHEYLLDDKICVPESMRSRNASVAEVGKNWMILLQGSRDENSMTNQLPTELLEKIVVETRNMEIHSEENAKKFVRLRKEF